MQTIQVDLQDDLYNKLLSRGVNIQSEIKEFLSTLSNDNYPSITTDEAKKRVAKSIERYKNGTGIYLDQDQYKQQINEHLNNLKTKYENHS